MSTATRHGLTPAMALAALILLAWEGGLPGTFAERAIRLQEQFHADVAHSAYSGVEVLRDLSRLHGERVLAPVVYTSALGLGALFSDEVKECFGEASWIISQGPQVWLDAQVTELNGGLLVNWDIREDAYTPRRPRRDVQRLHRPAGPAAHHAGSLDDAGARAASR